MLSHDVHSRQTQSRGGWRLDQLGRQYRSDRARSTIRPDPRRPAQMARHSCCRCCCHYDWWVCCCCWWWLSSTPRLRTWSAVSAKRLAWCASHGQKSSCEGAQRAGTEGSAWLGCYHWMLSRPDALTCHPRRAQPQTPRSKSVSNALKKRRWLAVMTPRDDGLRAAEVVASHRAADGTGPSIEPARTHAGGISRGAVAAVTCVWHRDPGQKKHSPSSVDLAHRLCLTGRDGAFCLSSQEHRIMI
jgi:hypothetical protein